MLYLLKDRSKEWQENNVRFVKEILDFINKHLEKYELDKRSFGIISALFVKNFQENKFSEIIHNIIRNSLENLGHKFVLNQLISLVNSNSNVKALIELCNLFNKMAEKNAKNVFQKELNDFLIMCCNHTNQLVRAGAISLFITLYKSLGCYFVFLLF